MKQTVVVATAVIVMVGCGSANGDPNGPCSDGQVLCDSYCIDEIESRLEGANGIQDAVFAVSCAALRNCHGGEGIAQAGLELSSVQVSAANLIDISSTQVPERLRVESGNSENSYLMDKILGKNLAPDTSRMPIGDVLCGPKVTAIRDWIDGLAPSE